MKKKIFVISIGYVTIPTPSDKKFVLDIVQNLSSEFDITVWSLNDMNDSHNASVNGAVGYMTSGPNLQ